VPVSYIQVTKTPTDTVPYFQDDGRHDSVKGIGAAGCENVYISKPQNQRDILHHSRRRRRHFGRVATLASSPLTSLLYFFHTAAGHKHLNLTRLPCE